MFASRMDFRKGQGTDKLELAKLRNKPRMIEQLDAAAVQDRQQLDVEIAGRLVGDQIGDALRSEPRISGRRLRA
jgi:hypothetical protein